MWNESKCLTGAAALCCTPRCVPWIPGPQSLTWGATQALAWHWSRSTVLIWINQRYPIIPVLWSNGTFWRTLKFWLPFFKGWLFPCFTMWECFGPVLNTLKKMVRVKLSSQLVKKGPKLHLRSKRVPHSLRALAHTGCLQGRYQKALGLCFRIRSPDRLFRKQNQERTACGAVAWRARGGNPWPRTVPTLPPAWPWWS